MDLKKAEMDSVESLVKEFRIKYGLLDYKAQAKEYSKALARATSKKGGSAKGIAEAKQLLNILAEKGGDFNTWNELLWKIRGGYSDLKTDYENLYKDATKELTYENIVTHASPSDKRPTLSGGLSCW